MNENEKPVAGAVEDRDFPLQAEGRRLRGRIPYGTESRDLGGFREVIEPGALNGARMDDLIATVDHAGVPIGRFPTTLSVEDRADGLHWSVEPPESRADVREAVERGDLRSGSWRMVVGRDEWRGDVRHVHEIRELRDVAVVTNPAYRDAAVELRNAPEMNKNTDGAKERQEDEDNMPTDTTENGAEDRSVEVEDTNVEDRVEGGLAVEDRAATETAPIETRVIEAMRNVRKGEARALSVASDGAIAPAEMSNFLFDKLRASSVALQSGITVITTDKSSVKWPHLTADVSPAWYGEADTITAGDPTLATLTATPKKLAHLVEASNEVIDDSDPSVVEVLNAHLATVLGLKLDLAIFEGSGSNDQPTGLRNTASIQTISAGTNGDALADYDKFLEAVGLLQAANAPGPYVAVCHPRTATELAMLKTGISGSVEQLPVPPQMPKVLTSSQIGITDTKGTSSDATSIYVYAPSEVVLVRRQDATIELDRSRLFNTDSSEIRGKLRADVLVPNPKAVVRISDIIPPA